MKFERTVNSTRNIIFGLAYKIISMVLPFVIRTIIVYKLGAEYLGLTSLFTSILTMLNMTELGIGSAITFCLYKPVADDDKPTICALLNLLRKLYTLIGVITMILGLSLLPFLPYLINSGYPADVNIYILYLIYLAQSVESYLMFAYKNVLLEVYQRADVVDKINILVELCKYLAQILVLLLFKNYYIFALLLPIAQIATNIIIDSKTKQMYPKLQPKGELSSDIKKVIRSKVLYLAAHSITSKFTNSVDNVVISAAMGLVPIAIYGNYAYISSAILAFVMVAYRAVAASVGNIMHTETTEKNELVYKGLSLMSWWGGTACSICLLCLFQPFITLWLGEDYLLSNIAMVLCCIYFYVNTQRQFLTMVYIGPAGLWNKTLFRQIFVTISNLVLDIVLVGRIGITGIIFSSAFTHLVIGYPLDIKVVCKNILNKSSWYGIKRVIAQMIASCSLAVATWSLSLCIETGNPILSFLIKGIVAVILPNAVILICVCRTEGFDFIFRRFRKKG